MLVQIITNSIGVVAFIGNKFRAFYFIGNLFTDLGIAPVSLIQLQLYWMKFLIATNCDLGVVSALSFTHRIISTSCPTGIEVDFDHRRITKYLSLRHWAFQFFLKTDQILAKFWTCSNR